MRSSLCRALMLGACVMAGSWTLVPLAQAAFPEAVPNAVVRYPDLDLSQARGVQILYDRIRGAARQVCAPYENAASPFPSAAWQRCYAQAVEMAVRRVDRPLLTAYHRRQEGHV